MGIGGGLIFTPILFYTFSSGGIANPVTFTVATSLFCIILVSTSSSLKQYRQDNLSVREAVWVGVFGAFGTSIGKYITTSSFYSETEFAIIFSIVLLYTAFNFFTKDSKTKNISQVSSEKEIKWMDGLLVGGIGGLLASLAGVGGGIIMVPLISMIYKKSFQKIVGITSLAIVLISLAAVIQFGWLNAPQSLSGYAFGFVDYGVALPLMIGGMFGAHFGASWSIKINKKILHKIFASLALLEAIRMIINHIFY